MDGVYFLTVYAITARTDFGPMFIKNNDDVLCQAYITDGATDVDTGTCSAIVELAVGDSVRVTGDSSDTAAIQAEYSGFAGHIINDNLSA